MAWLHNNGDEDEFAQFEEDEETADREPALAEEGEEEIVVTQRAGMPIAPPPPVLKPKSRSAGRSKPKARAKPKAKAKAKAKAKKKPAKKRPAKKAARRRGKRR
jgi:hypothetical protein